MSLFQVHKLTYGFSSDTQRAVFSIEMTEKGRCKCCSSETHAVEFETDCMSSGFLRRCDIIAALEILARQVRTAEINKNTKEKQYE